jgi:hypothetical protein
MPLSAVLELWKLHFFMFLLPFLALALATRSLFYNAKGRLHLPPGPLLSLPVVGNLHQIMGVLPHRSLRDLARRHGPVMQLRLGMVPTVVVSSAEAAREVLKTHDAACCSRPDTPGARGACPTATRTWPRQLGRPRWIYMYYTNRSRTNTKFNSVCIFLAKSSPNFPPRVKLVLELLKWSI